MERSLAAREGGGLWDPVLLADGRHRMELRGTAVVQAGQPATLITLRPPAPGSELSSWIMAVLDGAGEYAIVALDAAGTIVTWNQQASLMFGYASEEVMGQPWVQPVELERAAARGRVLQEEWRSRKSGERFWTSGVLTAVFKSDKSLRGFVHICRDLTAHKQAEERLQASEARYRALFEYAGLGILYADAASVYLDANESICRMLGYPRSELIGKHATDIVSAHEVPEIDKALEDIRVQSEHRREWTFRRRDGSTFPADVVATSLPDGTLLGIVRDLTGDQEHERQMARMSRLYSALSHVNQAIVWTKSPDELLAQVCRVLVEEGGLSFACMSWCRTESNTLEPRAWYGRGEAVAQSLGADTPAACAFRTETPLVYRTTMALPIRYDGHVSGCLTVQADRPQFFLSGEIALMEEVASDIGYALENFRR
ncbi:MAG TPA: PAS domain S-box protein, partial [Candidatus Xenobia bacterium]